MKAMSDKFTPFDKDNALMYSIILDMCFMSFHRVDANKKIVRLARKNVKRYKNKKVICRSMKTIIKHGNPKKVIIFALDNIHIDYAKDAGQTAYTEDKPRESNPYTKGDNIYGDKLYDAWLTGYDTCKLDNTVELE